MPPGCFTRFTAAPPARPPDPTDQFARSFPLRLPWRRQCEQSSHSTEEHEGHGESTATAAAMPVASHRRTFSGRKGLEPSSGGTAFGFGSYLSRSVNGTGPDPTASRKHSPTSIDENTVVDGSAPVGKPVSTKDRNRRASEGSYLVRGEGKRVSSELRCDQCGKGYKHSSCLTKHMCVSIPSHPYLPTTVTRAGNGQGLDFRASDVQAPLARREGESCLFRLDRPASLPETSCA
jgi:hypothetical protein